MGGKKRRFAMNDKPKKKLGRPRSLVPRDHVSRERIRQIQERAMGKVRKLLYARGITKMDDFI